MSVTLNDWYEEQYPEHCRTSCSDEHPVNADVDGSGCNRCNAIVFQQHSDRADEIETLRQRLADAERLLEDALPFVSQLCVSSEVAADIYDFINGHPYERNKQLATMTQRLVDAERERDVHFTERKTLSDAFANQLEQLAAMTKRAEEAEANIAHIKEANAPEIERINQYLATAKATIEQQRVRIERLETLQDDAARYKVLREIFTKSVGGGIEVNDAKLVYEECVPGEEVRVFWYPYTPIGFNDAHGSTLDEAVDARDDTVQHRLDAGDQPVGRLESEVADGAGQAAPDRHRRVLRLPDPRPGRHAAGRS